jgi:peptidoglycan/LPS O-acetylase OafA/YrhL
MALSYLKKEPFDARSYWWARVARILPVYLLAVLLMVASSFYTSDDISATALGLNLLLLQAWLPPYPLSINSPGWSLSVEAFFYLSFPFVLAAIRRLRLSGLVVFLSAMMLWLMTQILLSIALSSSFYQGYPSTSHDLIYYFPPSHYCSFLLGIAGGLLLLEGKGRDVNSGTSLAWVVVLFASILLTLNNQKAISELVGYQLAFGSSFLAPLFLFFILAVALCRSSLMSVFNARPLVLLGEASYSMYILQMPAHYVFSFLVKDRFTMIPLVEFLVFSGTFIVACILCFIWYERPMNRFLRPMFA